MQLCPCCSQKLYLECCEAYISAKTLPETPEQLMRSRYTAYTQANMDYIEQTMTGKAADGFDKNAAQRGTQSVLWLRLEVLNTRVQHKKGWVEFKAYYSSDNQEHQLHELSEFKNIKGKWFYINGFSRG